MVGEECEEIYLWHIATILLTSLSPDETRGLRKLQTKRTGLLEVFAGCCTRTISCETLGQVHAYASMHMKDTGPIITRSPKHEKQQSSIK